MSTWCNPRQNNPGLGFLIDPDTEKGKGEYVQWDFVDDAAFEIGCRTGPLHSRRTMFWSFLTLGLFVPLPAGF